MSGIEVVGLVLAVIPLIISATEHYRDGSNFVARAIKKEFLTAQYRDELVQQRVLLRLYVKAVVGKTDLPYDIQAEIAEGLSSSAWQDPKVVRAIAEELGDAHEPFLSVLVRVSRVLVKFVKTDKKPDNDTAAINQLQRLYSDSLVCMSNQDDHVGIWDRLKFSWKSSEWKSMIEELQSCNSMLERLSLAADRAKPFVKKQKSANVHTAFEHRAKAERLFNILQSSCNCQSAGLREIGIRLQASLRPKGRVNVRESMFRILIVDADDTPYEISAGVEMVPEYSVNQQVKFADLQTEQQQVIGDMKLLQDICSETRAAHASRTHLHLFADHTKQVYCTAVEPIAYASTQPTEKNFSSLSDVLKECQAYNTKRWLHKEKSILAIKLAYSLLQLFDGPWYSRWTSNNITFITEERKSKSGSESAQISLRQPYTRLPMSVPSSEAIPETQPKVGKKRIRRNVHLHALGIVLMELYLNSSIEEIAEEEGTDDLRSLAQELLEDHADDISMSPEYLEAVRFCLSPRPNPQNGSFDFKDEGFREIYYSEVIGMLEENLMQRFDAKENTWLGEN